LSRYLLRGGSLGVLGRFGAPLCSVEPSLAWPLTPPRGVVVDDPLAADPPERAALPPVAALSPRWQPASANAKHAAVIVKSFIELLLKKAQRHLQAARRCSIAEP
jgi:hypothetical protein